MNQAFSLVELSIVLVILGLLTGGILTGQNLIRAAELRSITTDLQRYQTAVQTFRGKYFALPGDMPNATDFWGAANTGGTNGNCSNPHTDSGTGTQTCNGDGNGFIFGTGTFYERARHWQHLSNAGMIEGSYTGVAADYETLIIGENVPPLRIGSSSCMQIGHTVGTDPVYPNIIGKQIIFMGANIAGAPCQVPFVTPQEAWNLDKKLDDGNPAQGKFQTGLASTYVGCTDSDDEDVAAYLLSSTATACMVGFIPW
jgi:prepilin-type N-terminal cleavage/methylation domain-containing protein